MQNVRQNIVEVDQANNAIRFDRMHPMLRKDTNKIKEEMSFLHV